MNSRNTIFIPLFSALVGLLIGAQQAHATNESSYKYGFEQGKAEWGNCMGFGADCYDGAVSSFSSFLTSL
jgi:hypothetical protein